MRDIKVNLSASRPLHFESFYRCARARAYSPFLWRFNRSSASCLKLARNAIKSACVLIRVPDCVSHVITLHPRTTRRTTYARSRSLFAKGLFPATIAPLFNHRARARPAQIKTACRDLLRGTPGQNGRRGELAETKTGGTLRGAPKRGAFIKMRAVRTAHRITSCNSLRQDGMVLT